MICQWYFRKNLNFFCNLWEKASFSAFRSPGGAKKGWKWGFFGRFLARQTDRRFSAVFFCAVIQFSRLNLLFQDTEIEVNELLSLLDRRQPFTFAVPALQRADRDIIRSSEICFHLLLKVHEWIELEILIEALVVVPVRTFHFSVMPGSPGLYQLMLDTVPFTKCIQGMKLLNRCLPCICKLAAIICLYDFRLISEIQKRTLKKIHRILCG